MFLLVFAVFVILKWLNKVEKCQIIRPFVYSLKVIWMKYEAARWTDEKVPPKRLGLKTFQLTVPVNTKTDGKG